MHPYNPPRRTTFTSTTNCEKKKPSFANALTLSSEEVLRVSASLVATACPMCLAVLRKTTSLAKTSLFLRRTLFLVVTLFSQKWLLPSPEKTFPCTAASAYSFAIKVHWTSSWRASTLSFLSCSYWEMSTIYFADSFNELCNMHCWRRRLLMS